MTIIFVALYIAIIGFEIDVRMNAATCAEASPWYPIVVNWALGIHLCAAISAFFLMPIAWWSGCKQYRRMLGESGRFPGRLLVGTGCSVIAHFIP